MLHTEIETLDEVLASHRTELGKDFTAYRNHTYRVLNLCTALMSDDREHLEKIAIGVAFHDLGIWTQRTFDYLKPSIELARAYLVRSGRAAWDEEIAAIILQHHKISRHRGAPPNLVEPFRQADWVDISRGALRFGLSRETITGIFSRWPNNGFHKKLVRLELKRLCTHPWHPLPMLRL